MCGVNSFLRWWRGEDDIVYADVEDYQRQRARRDVERQVLEEAAMKVDDRLTTVVPEEGPEDAS